MKTLPEIEIGWPLHDSIYGAGRDIRKIHKYLSHTFPKDYRSQPLEYDGKWIISKYGLSRSQQEILWTWLEKHFEVGEA